MEQDWMQKAADAGLTTETGALAADPESIAAYFSLSGAQVTDYSVHRLVG
jgi:hypothetical protein